MAISKIWTYNIPHAAPQIFQSYQLGTGLHEIAESIARSKTKKFDVVYSYPWNLSVLEAIGGLQGWVAFCREALQIKMKFKDRVQLWPMDEFLIYRHKTKLPVNTARQAQLLSLLQQTAPEAFSVLVSMESHAELKNREPLHLIRPLSLGLEFVQELFTAIERPAFADIQRVNVAQLNELSHRVQMEEVQIKQLLEELDAQVAAKAALEQAAKKPSPEIDKALQKEVAELKKKLAIQAKLQSDLKEKEQSLKLVAVQIAQLQAEIQRQLGDGQNMKNEMAATTDLIKRLITKI